MIVNSNKYPYLIAPQMQAQNDFNATFGALPVHNPNQANQHYFQLPPTALIPMTTGPHLIPSYTLPPPGVRFQHPPPPQPQPMTTHQLQMAPSIAKMQQDNNKIVNVDVSSTESNSPPTSQSPSLMQYTTTNIKNKFNNEINMSDDDRDHNKMRNSTKSASNLIQKHHQQHQYQQPHHHHPHHFNLNDQQRHMMNTNNNIIRSNTPNYHQQQQQQNQIYHPIMPHGVFLGEINRSFYANTPPPTHMNIHQPVNNNNQMPPPPQSSSVPPLSQVSSSSSSTGLPQIEPSNTSTPLLMTLNNTNIQSSQQHDLKSNKQQNSPNPNNIKMLNDTSNKNIKNNNEQQSKSSKQQQQRTNKQDNLSECAPPPQPQIQTTVVSSSASPSPNYMIVNNTESTTKSTQQFAIPQPPPPPLLSSQQQQQNQQIQSYAILNPQIQHPMFNQASTSAFITPTFIEYNGESIGNSNLFTLATPSQATQIQQQQNNEMNSSSTTSSNATNSSNTVTMGPTTIAIPTSASLPNYIAYNTPPYVNLVPLITPGYLNCINNSTNNNNNNNTNSNNGNNPNNSSNNNNINGVNIQQQQQQQAQIPFNFLHAYQPFIQTQTAANQTSKMAPQQQQQHYIQLSDQQQQQQFLDNQYNYERQFINNNINNFNHTQLAPNINNNYLKTTFQKKKSCYNCGSSSHMANECRESAFDQRKNSILKFKK